MADVSMTPANELVVKFDEWEVEPFVEALRGVLAGCAIGQAMQAGPVRIETDGVQLDRSVIVVEDLYDSLSALLARRKPADWDPR